MNIDDPLDDLIQSARRRTEKSSPTSPPPETKSAEKKALNPIELLTLPADQREVINYLSRQKQAHLKDIQAGVPTLSRAEVVEALQILKERGYIREVLLDGEVYYRVAFGGTTSRTKVYLPEDIWSSLNLVQAQGLQINYMIHRQPSLQRIDTYLTDGQRTILGQPGAARCSRETRPDHFPDVHV